VNDTVLIDTDVLIWYLRGHLRAAQFLDALPSLALSSVTYMELAQGCRNRGELNCLKEDLRQRQAIILPITESVSNLASQLIEAHCFASGLQLADALIAATAIEHKRILVSANGKHFRVIPPLNLQIFEP
jgi:predicted nucleic acid-binding protein